METQAEYKVSSQQIDIDEVLKKINEIARESATGNYIYRGEPAHYKDPPYYGRVTSGLYRQYIIDIEAEHFNVAVVQADILRAAHEYAPHKMEDFEILATLQHFGDKTNLIDFTTDYLVALFFACDGEPKQPGRVILFQREPEGDPKPYEVKKPPRTIRRAEAQKSIFVQSTKGFVEPDRIVDIPPHLKAVLLDYLRNHHDISTKTIYNDFQGFIENRGLHENAYTEFYKGVTSQERAASAKTEAERQRWYDDAITHYTAAIDLNLEDASVYNNRGDVYRNIGDFAAAIEAFNRAIGLNPDLAEAYSNRGEAWLLHLKEWQKANADLTTAKDMGYNIIASFQNDYESVEDFEAKNKVNMPRDIAVLLQRTNPSSKSAKYRSYTQMLIDELREKHKFTRARAGQPYNWYTFSSGIRGISYRVKFARGDEVWTYVNIHDDVHSNRLDLFDALEQRKEEIESAFGSLLEWERLEEQKRSRIFVSRDGNIELPDDELERDQRMAHCESIEVENGVSA